METRKAGQMYGDGFQISNTSHLMAYTGFQVSSKIIPLVYILLLFKNINNEKSHSPNYLAKNAPSVDNGL